MPPNTLGFWIALAIAGWAGYLGSLRIKKEPVRTAVQLLAYVIGGAGINQLSYASYFGPVGDDPGVFWLSSGLSIGVLLSVSWRRYPLFVAGCALFHLHSGLVVNNLSLGTAVFWAGANVTEAVVGSLLMRLAIGDKPDITQPKVFMLFCLLCAGAAPAISAAIGTATLALMDGGGSLFQNWEIWFFSDALGVLSLGTAVLAWGRPSGSYDRLIRKRGTIEAATLLLLLVVVAWITVGPARLATRSVLDYPYLVFPFLVWAALRFNARMASVAALSAATITVYTANGVLAQLLGLPESDLGPFRQGGVEVEDAVLAIQAFLFVTLLATHLIVALTYQHNRSVNQTLDMRDQIYELQRKESIAQLAGGVAHDLNNLLAVITIYRDQVEHRVGNDPEISEALKAMDYASENATALARSLLDLSRHDSIDDGPVDLVALMRRATEICKPLLGSDIRLKVSTHPGVNPTIIGDAKQLQQVLINLMVNASDAMQPDGGAMHVWVGEAQDKPGMVELGVSDTGVGISPHNLSRVFEPLFTTKPHGYGTGLGLSIVRTIVTEHQGDVLIDSTPGQGTTVRVLLPLAPEPESPPNESMHRTGVFVPGPDAASKAIEKLNSPTTAHILLLIENKQLSGALAAELTEAGCQVLVCPTLQAYEQAIALNEASEGTLGVVDLRAAPDPDRFLNNAQPFPTLLISNQSPPPRPRDPKCDTIGMPFRLKNILLRLSDIR